MKEIIFATHNSHKLAEVNTIFDGKVKLIGLNDLHFYEEIEETADTLEGNALLKANAIYKKFNKSCFADDTGLEIDALDGSPGVFSARYAGQPTDSKRNIQKVLHEMEQKKNRKAKFRTVITFIASNGAVYSFEGIVHGKIAASPIGKDGFGYDPIFIPDGYDKSFSQLSANEKNNISHRGKAISKLADFLFAKQ